jgi:hypothetical protein
MSSSQVPGGGLLRFIHTKLAAKGDIFHITFGAWHRKGPSFPYNAAGHNHSITSLAQYYKVSVREIH